MLCLGTSGSVSRRLAWGANTTRLGFSRSLSRGLIGSRAMYTSTVCQATGEMGQIIPELSTAAGALGGL